MNPSRANHKGVSLYCILSLPRSGSTVLASELDRIKGIVCIPENYFPCLLYFIDNWSALTKEELADLFISSTDDSMPLEKKDVVACVVKESLEQTLVNIGLILAGKFGRDVEDVKAVVWKTTRLISGIEFLKAIGFSFIILERDKVNVFGSQFRVNFGRHNRRALRFSIFRLSYLSVFRGISRDIRFDISYSDIKFRMADLISWLGLEERSWDAGESIIVSSMASSSWHRGLSKEFNNQDLEKRYAVDFTSRNKVVFYSFVFYPLVYFLKPIRKRFDELTARKIASRPIKKNS